MMHKLFVSLSALGLLCSLSGSSAAAPAVSKHVVMKTITIVEAGGGFFRLEGQGECSTRFTTAADCDNVRVGVVSMVGDPQLAQTCLTAAVAAKQAGASFNVEIPFTGGLVRSVPDDGSATVVKATSCGVVY
jgi:hypothetical protein